MIAATEEAMMPRFRRLSEAETAALRFPPPGTRAQVAREYDEHLADFAIGDYGRADLAAGDVRSQVRSRLHAAAKRRGLALRFRPGPTPALIFHVEVAPPPLTRPAPTPAAGVERRRDGAARRAGAPPRRRQTAAERYHNMLPRWMREGQQPGRREGSKRRPK